MENFYDHIFHVLYNFETSLAPVITIHALRYFSTQKNFKPKWHYVKYYRLITVIIIVGMQMKACFIRAMSVLSVFARLFLYLTKKSANVTFLLA